MCGQVFLDFRVLGGHFRRYHPGRVSTYSKMKEIRDERILDRKAFALAKEKLT